jgi:hypothetical protein
MYVERRLSYIRYLEAQVLDRLSSVLAQSERDFFIMATADGSIMIKGTCAQSQLATLVEAIHQVEGVSRVIWQV